MKQNKLEKLFSLEDLAGQLRMSRGTVYNNWRRWRSEGRIKTVLRINGSWRFSESEVIRLIDSFRVQELEEIFK